MSAFESSIANEATDVWTDGEYEYTELAAQPYTNCKFSVGMVDGHSVDGFYLKWEKPEVSNVGWLLLRRDEVAALNYLLAALLWSDLVAEDE